MLTCVICENDKEYKSVKSLSIHLRKHDMFIINYYINHLNFSIPICACGKACKLRKGIKFNTTCCSASCIAEHHSNRKHTVESKQKISEIRKTWLKNNPDKHPWKNNEKFISFSIYTFFSASTDWRRNKANIISVIMSSIYFILWNSIIWY